MKILAVPASCLLLVLLATAVAAEEPTWNETLQRIASGVVSIEIDSTRSFDTEQNESAQATGFVVDAKRGLILTNRHVVTPGPVRARAIFMNQEEVDLQPVYRDPVHDFGFYRYDPRDLHFIHPAELPLAPDAARVGMPIRVVGNDAGERLSILAGTIARLDRPAPDYGRGNYNDFNTFYLQAASGTSGGSSGSPVIDIQGRVVALNAGANSRSQSSFFLPLDRIHVALTKIQQGLPVPRGTLQTEFVQQPYAELRRLGLTRAMEARTRAEDPDAIGMLVVKQVIPQSPAFGKLRPGDILLTIDGKPVHKFVPLAAALDTHVGQSLPLEVERQGRKVGYDIPVDNLHDITPAEYIEYGGAILHELSYQQARHYYRPARGIYVADPGYVFGSASIPRASILTEIDGHSVVTLDDLERVLESLPEDAEISVRYVEFDDPRMEHQTLFTNSRGWFAAARCKRDDTTGLWPCTPLAPSAPPVKPKPQTTSFPSEATPRLTQIAQSLVLVHFSMPYTISGVSTRYYYGTGLIIDAKRGWVVVDRNTVPVSMGDVQLTFAGSVEVPGHVEYVNPLHNLAVVSYDPKLLGETPVRSVDFSAQRLMPGDKVTVIGLSSDNDVRSLTTEVATMTEVKFPVSRTLRFRESNVEAATLVNQPTDFTGAILDSQGRVTGVWASFAVQSARDVQQVDMGLPGYLVTNMLAHMRSGNPVYTLDIEWRLMPLATARKLKLPEAWASQYEAHNPERREVMAIDSPVAGSPAAQVFRSGDILLSIDGKLANTFREVEELSQAPSVSVVMLREGREIKETIPTVALNGRGIDRIVLWAGALVQPPQRALAVQRGIPPKGVYVSYFNFGSPASRSGLYAGRRIISVDGQPTPDLDRFIEVIKGLGEAKAVRLTAINWNREPQVITLEPDPLYWPSYELKRVGNVWQRVELASDAPAAGAVSRPTNPGQRQATPDVQTTGPVLQRQ